jgi:uncharacterized SAM-binding protein YcdF (DUF218 family)
METHSGGARAAAPNRRHPIAGALAFLLALYVLGLVVFGLTLPPVAASADAAPENADAIIALTGDGDRLGTAVMLLEKGRGRRLLITGVNKATTKRQLKTLLHGGPKFECCADLGFAAVDTRGNAEEAAQWVRAHHYTSVIVVTASYHMPRSLTEFSAAMPDVKLVAFPVAAEVPNATPWQSLKRVHGEYAKYLASLARASFNGMLRKFAT